jgi:hypothetical protein
MEPSHGNLKIGGYAVLMVLGKPKPTFLVLKAKWTHTDPIPNSDVKRFCGEDTWRVASWNNSSVPGSFFQKTSSLHMKGFFAFLSEQGFEWYFALCH